MHEEKKVQEEKFKELQEKNKELQEKNKEKQPKLEELEKLCKKLELQHDDKPHSTEQRSATTAPENEEKTLQVFWKKNSAASSVKPG